MISAGAHIRRETALSAGINAAISAGFFLATFGLGSAVPVWGTGHLAFDFLPQSFAVSLFASLIPSILTRKAIGVGKLAPGKHPTVGVAGLIGQSVLVALGMTLVGGGLCAAVLWLSGVEAIDALPAFAVKVLYGGALGALVTRYRLAAMLR